MPGAKVQPARGLFEGHLDKNLSSGDFQGASCVGIPTGLSEMRKGDKVGWRVGMLIPLCFFSHRPFADFRS